jgi:RimJ/RimL family protein N-acetyltransferase
MPLLHTARLTLRPVCSDDFDWMTALSADARVMATLGGVRSTTQVRAWLDRELSHFEQHGFGRNVVEHQSQPIGLVGLSRRDFDSGIVSGIEVAWQLAYAHWGQGFATEAAQRVIEDAFGVHGIDEVLAVTSVGNARSRSVMARLGMVHSPDESFEHPHLAEGDPLRTHVVYRLRRDQFGR